MSDGDSRVIPEQVVEGQRLGRHLQHDPRSRNFPAAQSSQVVTKRHHHHGPVLDQGDLGSCTGNAVLQALMTSPDWSKARSFTEQDALDVYSLATTLDDVQGSYPPDDTGSTGLAVCKAAQQKGYITSYSHAFGLDQTLAALVLTPVIVGVNWYEGFDNPDVHGFVSISGSVRGGHEFALVGLNADERVVIALNSWGHSWGRNGFFVFSFDDLGRLLSADGDATVPNE
jgi:C1A family cysteine protease